MYLYDNTIVLEFIQYTCYTTINNKITEIATVSNKLVFWSLLNNVSGN